MSTHSGLFDASALVKVFSDEPGSDLVRQYFYTRPSKYTTPFCFYEAMNILKSKWKYKRQLSLDEYYKATFELTAWHGAWSKDLNDIDFSDPVVFTRTRQLAEKFGLDLSDAFQILSVKQGAHSIFVNESATVLVTADDGLATAARSEGIRVWSVMREPAPA